MLGENITAGAFIQALRERAKVFKSLDHATNDALFAKMPIQEIFGLGSQFKAMALDEIETLLENENHTLRMGAISIMDAQARDTQTPETQRKALFDLYIRRHDLINNWDLVDRSAPFVVGAYLFDKPRDILFALAQSSSEWERHTAIVATSYFIRQGDVEHTFKIAELLAHDPHELVQKAVGTWIRQAGTKDHAGLLSFLDTYAATMPHTMLHHAITHLDSDQREHYLNIKKHQR